MPEETVRALIDKRMDVTPDMAHGLGTLLNTSAAMWISLQNAYDD